MNPIMGTKSRKKNNVNRKLNIYILGIGMGLLIGVVFGMASGSWIASILVCGLLGYGMGYAIEKTISG